MSKSLLVFKANKILDQDEFKRIKNWLSPAKEALNAELIVTDNGNDVIYYPDLGPLIEAVRQQADAVTTLSNLILNALESEEDQESDEGPAGGMGPSKGCVG